ncbi:MAG: alpha/beta fold hydrolase [Chloroflexi bacterium]|nr:alpha/beta fold hydrolase [Chloroflexota bacterium]
MLHRMRRHPLLIWTFVLCVFFGRPAQAQERPLFEEAECLFPAIEGVTCGYLIVPEDRRRPDGATVELAVAIIRPRRANADPVPVVYLEGGPGNAPLIGLDAFLSEPIVENHTLILFDQRGTGFSLPSLNCWEMEEEDADDDALAACRDRLLDEGVDLQMYNSAASAADVYDLVTTLGYEQVDLWGISYGTKLGLTILRDYPEIVRSAVLDSVYAPETDDLQVQTSGFLDALYTLFASCAADRLCDEVYPDLENDFFALLAYLDAEPLTFDYDGVEVVLDGAALYDLMFQILYDTQAIPFLPYAITLLAYGESVDDFADAFSILSGGEYPVPAAAPPMAGTPIADSDEVLDYIDEFGDIEDSEGMAYSVDCQEEYQLNDVDAALRLAEAAPAPLNSYMADGINSNLESCETWGVETADPIETERVLSDVPTLLFAGAFDPITPIASAESALQGLTNGTLLVFPSAGHGITFTYNAAGDCAKGLMLDFLADPGAALETQCIEETGVIDFYAG